MSIRASAPSIDKQVQEDQQKSIDEAVHRALSYSKMIADVEWEEEMQGSTAQDEDRQRKQIEYSKNLLLADQPEIVSKLTGPTQTNYLYKPHLDEKLKNSQQLPVKVEQRPQFVSAMGAIGNIQNNPSETRGFVQKIGRRGSQDNLQKCGESRSTTVTKGLGSKIVSSVIKNDILNEDNPIQEQSVVMANQTGDIEGSHFEPVAFSLQDSQPFLGANIQNGAEYVIITSSIKKDKAKDSQMAVKRQDSRIQYMEEVNGDDFLKKADLFSPQSPKSIKNQPNAIVMPKLSTKIQGPNEIEEAKGEKRLLHSKIIKRSSKQIEKIEKMEKSKVNLPEKKEEPQDRMKLTIDPHLKNSEFKEQNKEGKFSEPARRGSKMSVSRNNDNDFYKQVSQRNKLSEADDGNYSAKAILQKLTKIQNAMIMLKQNSERASSDSNKNLKKEGKNKDKKESAFRRQKIESINKMLPEDFFQMSSEIKKISKIDKSPKQNSQMEEEINLLKQKIMELERKYTEPQIKSPKSKDSKPTRKYSQCRNIVVKSPESISINFKQYNQMSLGKVLSKQYLCQNQGQHSEKIEIDEDLENLQKNFPHFDRIPRIDDNNRKIADLGKKALETFGINLDQFGELNIKKLKDAVLYELSKGPALIILIWEYSGKIYLEKMEGRGRGAEGRGFELMPNKYIYQGGFHKNMRSGFGLMVNINSGQKYKGGWKNNVYEGKGILITKYTRYQGQFSKGLQQGQGSELFSNGDSYEGDYFDGKFHGKGKYVWKTNNNSYEGEFKKGYLQGEGVWKGSNGDSYEGQYYKSMKHGYGIYRWKNGKVFQGKFQHGHRVSVKSPNKRVLSPEMQIPYDLNQSSECHQFRRYPNLSLHSNGLMIRMGEQSISQRLSPRH